MHGGSFDALDSAGSLLYSGRFHRGHDAHPVAQTFAALYMALNPETSLGEVVGK